MSQTQAKVTDFFQHRKSIEIGTKLDASKETNSSKKSNETCDLRIRTTLKPEDVRKKLGKVKNLDALRQRLSNFSEAAARLNEEHRLAQLNVQTIEKNTSPYKSSPCKSAPLDANANEVAAASPQVEKPSLELPLKYKYLSETFESADLIVSLMHNQTQVITFDKLKTRIQDMTRKHFEKSHLGQIKTVYPEAYVLTQRKLSSKFSNNESRADQFCLVIEPNFETDLKTYDLKSPTKTPVKRQLNFGGSLTTPPPSPVKFIHRETSPKKTPTKFYDEVTLGQRKYFSAGRRKCRKDIFQKNLLAALNEEHKKFLAKLNPPLILTHEEESQLKRWHPEFQLNQVPDLPAAELPEPPFVEKIFTAKEMLLQYDKTNTKDLPLKVEKALQTCASKSDLADSEKIISDVRKKCLKGIPASVIAKVRAKESLRQQKLMHSNKEDEIKQQRLARLPDIIRIIKGFFATEHKNVLALDKIVDKLRNSYSKSIISTDELENTLKLLTDHSSKWLTKTTIQGKETTYIRINKIIDSNDLIQQFSNLANKNMS